MIILLKLDKKKQNGRFHCPQQSFNLPRINRALFFIMLQCNKSFQDNCSHVLAINHQIPL